MIDVIIPAAGESRRFKKKGIVLPKPLIKFSYSSPYHSPVGTKKTMLEHALFGTDQQAHVGIMREHAPKFKEVFKDSKNLTFHELTQSRGQAHTVAQVVNATIQDIPKQSPFLVLNSDSMFLYPLRTFLKQAENFEAAALVFDGQYSPIYSYIDKFPIFNRTVEKDPISQWAFAGAFYFRSKYVFLNAYEQYRLKNAMKEEYLSEVYNYIMEPKLAVYMPREQWVVWGTAEELLNDENVNDLEF